MLPEVGCCCDDYHMARILGIEKDVVACKAAQDASYHCPAIIHSDNVAHLLQLERNKETNNE